MDIIIIFLCHDIEAFVAQFECWVQTIGIGESQEGLLGKFVEFFKTLVFGIFFVKFFSDAFHAGGDGILDGDGAFLDGGIISMDMGPKFACVGGE